MTGFTARRSFCRLMLGAGAFLAAPVFADARKLIVSKSTIDKSANSTSVDPAKHKLIRFKLSGVDANKILIKGRRKTTTLKQTMQALKFKSSAKEVLLARDPSDFPGISSETLKKVRELKDGESIVIYGKDTLYGCHLLNYYCI